MLRSLQGHGLLEDVEGASFEVLTGGVSSDIWKVSADGRVYCVKRALPKLKVAADWFAPVERNRFEVAWYRIANRIMPGSAPRILAHDDEAMLFAMDYLDPQTHKLWKTELRDGHADAKQAARAGSVLGRIHSQAANDDGVKAQFPRTDIFQAIRLEPYLEATADRHTDLRRQLLALRRRTAGIARTMIHGDVSPKNILLGPDGPVFLDAECACLGDPAFDMAFCLNHFLLKCLWTPSAQHDFIACFEAMASSYLNAVDWEDNDIVEQRAASLLPALFLARVDGKSPVEYITNEGDKDKVRHCARALLFDPPARLIDVQDFMVIAVGADCYARALEWTAEVYLAAGRLMQDAGLLQGVADEGGFWPAFDANEQALDFLMRAIERAGLTPGEDVAISLDIAATDFYQDGHYQLSKDGKIVDAQGLAEMLLRWLERYPIVAIEDPLGEDDTRAMAQFTKAAGDAIEVVADDFVCTSAAHIQAAAAEGACNTALIKPNQAGTLSETKAALEASRKAGWEAIVSARSGETEDTTIVHLAVGWGVKQLKVGSFARSERMAKWNEGLRIAASLGPGGGMLSPRQSFPWG